MLREDLHGELKDDWNLVGQWCDLNECYLVFMKDDKGSKINLASDVQDETEFHELRRDILTALYILAPDFN